MMGQSAGDKKLRIIILFKSVLLAMEYNLLKPYSRVIAYEYQEGITVAKIMAAARVRLRVAVKA